MSIIHSFDTSRAMINPVSFQRKIANKCIVGFSCYVLDYVLDFCDPIDVDSYYTANGREDIYLILNKGEKILYYMSPIGAASAGTVMDEVAHRTGATKFVVFGSCGSLIEIPENHLILPTEAYRDEGFSYHFVPASDYIKIQNQEILSEILNELEIPYVAGKTWTTDAIYRETENQVRKRREEGCISVEMECSGLQALCDFRGYEFYPFFFTSDFLGKEWKNINLGKIEEREEQVRCFQVALRITEKI